MTSLDRNKYRATKSTPSDGVAAPCVAEGASVPTKPNQEDVMTKNTPNRPWLENDVAQILTDADLAYLDRMAAVWANDPTAQINEILRADAREIARIRRMIGKDEVPLPSFVKLPNLKSTWELTEPGDTVVRFLDAEHVDAGELVATLEADQYASTGRVDTRVTVDAGQTDDPAQLTEWAGGLLALAGRWAAIKEAHQ